MAEKGLLVVSFGSTHEDTQEKAIAAAERELAAAFPDRKFYRAWSARFIRRKMAERGTPVDSPEEALERMAADGITDVLVQPTFLTPNVEYLQTLDDLRAKKDRFDRIACGTPVITTEADAAALADVIMKIYPMREWEALVLMGHGTEPGVLPDDLDPDRPYKMLAEAFEAKEGQVSGAYIVGVLEAGGGIDAVCEQVRELSPSGVTLAPLLVTAGDHAKNDMAGDEPDSWKNVLSEMVPTVGCIVKGLGEYAEFRALCAEHARRAEEI